MSETSSESTNIYKKAWNDFIRNNVINESLIRPEIAASWLRSKGVDPYDRFRTLVSDEIISKKLKKYSDIIIIARPLLEELAGMVNKSTVCLADPEGVILDVVGNNELFPIGYSCHERYIGTNAIGTALIEKKPFTISGFEHYRYGLRSFYSVGIPMLNDSEIIGVLNLTTLFNELPREAIQIARYIAKSIIAYVKGAAEMSSVIDCALHGVFIIDEKGKIYNINKHAAETLGLENRKDVISQHLSKYVIETDELLKDIKIGAFREIRFKLKSPNGLIKCTIRNKQRLQGLNDAIGDLYLVSFANNGKIDGAEHDQTSELSSFSRLVGSSAVLTRCKELAVKASKVSSNVLIIGESGTGKEMLTQAIHRGSGRKGAFIPINCGAISKELLQSELFGYEDGAFTGAKKGGAIGKFEMADGGTIFLDEIGEMPLEMQVSLLRFLQDKTIFKVGSTKSKVVDVRVIAATNRDLEEAIINGSFRKDLYYRLNVVSIKLPPLRQRKEDIPELAESIVDELYEELHFERPRITDETYQIFLDYDWPGNVRELRNVIEHAIIFADGVPFITPNHLPIRLMQRKELEQASDLRSRELIIIDKALADHNGNISQTAKALGITRSTLYRKIKELQIISDNVNKLL